MKFLKYILKDVEMKYNVSREYGKQCASHFEVVTPAGENG